VFDEEMASLEPAPADDGAPSLVRLPSFADARGVLSVAETGGSLPFVAERYFLVRGVPPGAARAQHAQGRGHELISCVAGACTVEVWWEGGNAVHRLEEPGTALHVPPGVWVECREFSADAILLVLCSEPYDPADQVTDFESFRSGHRR
jgi:UDP-2-acetamido-3-amino-2,3-dideoxy-glucuronate N-acetyltransferase